MTDQNKEQEPSMEEILASIRRIISEDGDENKTAAVEREFAEPVAAAAPDMWCTMEKFRIPCTDACMRHRYLVANSVSPYMSKFDRWLAYRKYGSSLIIIIIYQL